MTCDDSRPCKRCVSRGLGDSCIDAPRKRKKYLMDIPKGDLEMSRKDTSSFNEMSSGSLSLTPADPLQGEASNSGYNSPLNLFQYDTDVSQYPVSSLNSFRKTPFLSSAANLEYSVLGNIVNDPYSPSMSPSNYVSLDETQVGTIRSYPNLPNNDNLGGNGSLKRSGSQLGLPIAPKIQGSYNIPQLPIHLKQTYERRRSGHNSVGSDQQLSIYSSNPRFDSQINQYYIGPVHGVNEEINTSISFPQIIDTIRENQQINLKSFFNNKGATISFSVGLTSEDEYNRKVVDQGNILLKHGGLKYKEPSEIYHKIQQPFSYYPGYHELLSYLTSRFDKTQLVSMAKTMAEYRPSFIAATCNLKEDDLIFMEQCFQRTLLEYDNYISISGTPTLVWRRTGQIAYVGNEFCILTGWSKKQLLDKVSFLVELLDDNSCLEYFKLFNKIAFGDFRGASMSECTIVSPEKKQIRCRCIMTLKRDVFGIPMMIIGNFLPILSEYGEVEA